MTPPKVYWQSVRPFTFTMSVAPPLLGSLLAVMRVPTLSFNWFHFILTVLGCMMAHAAANVLSDYADFKKKVDREGTYGSSGVLVAKLIEPVKLLRWSALLYSLTALIGAYLVWAAPNGLALLWLIALGGVLGFFYTIGPFHFKYHALGDIAVFIAFGSAMTLGAYMVQTGRFAWQPVLYALPISFLVDAVLHSNNLRDIKNDLVVDIKTIPILIGEAAAKKMYYALLFSAYALILILIGLAGLPWLTLLTFLSLPLALKRIAQVHHKSDLPPNQFAVIDAATAQLHGAFSLLLLLGLLGDWYL
ncbi:MAG: 1,4-dihydroxy-2-naphthoate octaprenyltransferase [bacterium ADurb.Bin478]|nr:MAG: 1,4-dihydroxy-2-naphthoate octaprenyltransferase [bacterium ADurb.Bin478]